MSKEYLDNIFGKKKSKMVDISIKRLRPPAPPIPVVKFDSNYDDIDFNKIANSSEFKRLIYLIYTGKTHRGTKKDLDREIKEKQEDVRKTMIMRDLVKEIEAGVELKPMGSYTYEPYEEEK